MIFHFRISLNQFFVGLFFFLFIEVKGKRSSFLFDSVGVCARLQISKLELSTAPNSAGSAWDGGVKSLSRV